MKKDQLFNALLQVVSEECEITAEEILSTNRSVEVVDARHILVKCLSECGMYVADMARLTGLSVRSINHILCEFDNRIRFGHYMRNNYARVRQRISNNHFGEQ